VQKSIREILRFVGAVCQTHFVLIGLFPELDAPGGVQRAGRHMAFVELRSRLQDLIGRYGLYESFDRTHFYPSIETALHEIAGDDD